MGLRRLIQVYWVIMIYRLDQFLPSRQVPFGIRVMLWLMPWRYLIPTRFDKGKRLRLALEKLGPVFVKFGQMLSTRKDLLPQELADELAWLQDKVPPFPGNQARKIIEGDLKRPIEAMFDNFDETPLASASVAQVHPARLKNGDDVVVKVIRPGIRRVIDKDLRLLTTIAMLVNRIPDGRRLRPVEVVDEYRKTILDELDLIKEGANAVSLRRNFEDSTLLYIPAIYWDFSSSQVLTMERIYGIPVSDTQALIDQGTDMKLLAERGVEIFFTQVFRDSFFHADMHPGNVFVSTENPAEPAYIGIDCGIVGSLSEDDLNYLALTLLAFFNRDYRQVAQLHVDSGWVPPHTRVNEFENAIRGVCEPIFQKPLAEISFGIVLVRLFQTARRFDMEVQPQLVLLQKTLLNIEGLGRQLYPQLDLWQTAKPFLESWLKDRLHPLNTLQRVLRNAPAWLERAPLLPDLLFSNIQNAQHTRAENQRMRQELLQIQKQQNKLQRAWRWRWLALISLLTGLFAPVSAEIQYLFWVTTGIFALLGF